jgi:hypothetical protein
MPVEFLTDDEAAAYGRYAGVPSQADLERVFFLDDEDRALIERRRGGHMKLGTPSNSSRCGGSDRSWRIRWMCRRWCWTSSLSSWGSPTRRW